jgi:hypothetical protein
MLTAPAVVTDLDGGMRCGLAESDDMTWRCVRSVGTDVEAWLSLGEMQFWLRGR